MVTCPPRVRLVAQPSSQPFSLLSVFLEHVPHLAMPQNQQHQAVRARCSTHSRILLSGILLVWLAVTPDTAFGSFARLPGLPLGNYPKVDHPTLGDSGGEKFRANSKQHVQPDISNGLVKPQQGHAVAGRMFRDLPGVILSAWHLTHGLCESTSWSVGRPSTKCYMLL